MSFDTVKRYSALILTGIAAGAMFSLPYLRDTYFIVLRESLDQTSTQMGLALSAYAAIFWFIALPSGYLSDRFPAKKLLPFCTLLAGLSGYYYATLPSFYSCVVIFCVWSFTCTMYWPLMTKISRVSDGEGDASGKSYGIIESARAMTYACLGFLSIPLFSWLGGERFGIQGVIIMYSTMLMVISVLCFFLLEDDGIERQPATLKNSFNQLKSVFQSPQVWLLGGVVFASQSIYICTGMLVPYLQEIFNFSQEQATVFGVVRSSVLMSIAGITGGFYSRKLGSVTKLVSIGYIGIFIGGIAVFLVPSTPQYVWLLIPVALIMLYAVATNHTMFMAPMKEIGIPFKDMGMATMAISLIGFSSEIVMYSVVGKLVDSFSGSQGYKYVFLLMIFISIVGFLLILAIRQGLSSAVTINQRAVNVNI